MTKQSTNKYLAKLTPEGKSKILKATDRFNESFEKLIHPPDSESSYDEGIDPWEAEEEERERLELYECDVENECRGDCCYSRRICENVNMDDVDDRRIFPEDDPRLLEFYLQSFEALKKFNKCK